MTMPKKITAIYAWIVTETDGSEGLPGMTVPGLGFTPLIGADMERVKSLRPHALAVADLKGLPLKLCMFSKMEELERVR